MTSQMIVLSEKCQSKNDKKQAFPWPIACLSSSKVRSQIPSQPWQDWVLLNLLLGTNSRLNILNVAAVWHMDVRVHYSHYRNIFCKLFADAHLTYIKLNYEPHTARTQTGMCYLSSAQELMEPSNAVGCQISL